MICAHKFLSVCVRKVSVHMLLCMGGCTVDVSLTHARGLIAPMTQHTRDEFCKWPATCPTGGCVLLAGGPSVLTRHEQCASSFTHHLARFPGPSPPSLTNASATLHVSTVSSSALPPEVESATKEPSECFTLVFWESRTILLTFLCRV